MRREGGEVHVDVRIALETMLASERGREKRTLKVDRNAKVHVAETHLR